jgi:hypothetical protein
MKMKHSLLSIIIAGVALPFAAHGAITLNSDGLDVYTENFADLPGGDSATWTDDTTIAGWFSNKTTIDGNITGGDNGLLRYGGTEYALGSRNTGGNPTVVFGANFTNNIGQAISSINIDYQGEQWYVGSQTTNAGLVFEYSTDATSLSTGSWTAVSALDFDAIQNSGSGTLLAPGNELVVSSIASDISLSVANGSSFWIRWTDTDDGTGTDHGLAVDSFKLDVTVVPEPSTYALFAGLMVLGGVMFRRRFRT